MKKLLVFLSLLFCFNLSFGEIALEDLTFLNYDQLEEDLPKFPMLLSPAQNENFVSGDINYSELESFIYIKIQNLQTEELAKEYFDKEIKFNKDSEFVEEKSLTEDTAIFMHKKANEKKSYQTFKMKQMGQIVVEVDFPTLLEGENADEINKDIEAYFSKPFSEDFDYKTWIED